MARKPAGKSPSIQTLSPEAAIAGGEIRIHGKGFTNGAHPRVLLGDVQAPLIIGSDSYIIARVPEEAVDNVVKIESGNDVSEATLARKLPRNSSRTITTHIAPSRTASDTLSIAE